MLPILTSILPMISTVLDRVIPDKEASAKAIRDIEATLIENSAQINLAQLEINKVEAGHKSIWVSGWRPSIGWCCSLGIFWAYIGRPVADYAVVMSGSDIILPEIPTDALMELTFAMLGMAGLRTFEKLKNISR
jgi:hypothetical protein|tara:strand:- start:9454 stop:9855 length:402 start_codon:yes stop_codon:yes gene_type:complete